ncbi:MAG: OmpA family protein [Bacteroidota bacterium]|jgi:peptidoglycan-associated lipoprotein|nr:OmpA family protein [Sphingobacteriales bacterium]
MKRVYYFLLATFISAALTQSCKPGKGSMAAAREAFAKKEFFTAGENYKAVYSKTKNKDEKNEACFKTAECYRLSNDMKNAENWFRKTVKADPKNTEALWRLAQSLKANQKFTEAIVEFNNYKKQMPSDARADDEVKGCEQALKWKNEKTRYVIENVKAINSKWSDFAPMWYKKDQLFFTSDRENGVGKAMYGWTGNGYTDLYNIKFKIDKKNADNIKYEIPILADKENLNGKLNDGTIAFDSKFTVAYLTKCNYDNNGKGKNCRIYTSTGQGSEWSIPEPLSFSTDSFTCGHPYLSKDGQTLYFTSDMPGGEGGKDIWMVTYSKKGKSWGDPINLGPTINTEGDEMFPYMHEDGTLYFSSNGHVGLGGVDIFFSKGEATDWSTPINMKSPINSGGDDFSLILDKTKESGYFSSNREGGKGQDDIYRFRMTPLVFTLSGVARDLKTRELLASTILTITNSTDTGKLIIKTDARGFYKITLKPKTDYELFGAHEDYYDSKIYGQTTRGLEVSTDLVQDLELDPFDYEKAFEVEGVYYDLDKANIRADAAIILDTVVYLLNRYPKIRLELGSHTDCRSDSLYNKDLSQRRADSAVAYIVSRGIDKERLVAAGYGESQLVNDCECEGKYVKRVCSEEEHQMNRRTTIRLLGNDYVPKNKEEMKKSEDKTQVNPQQRGNQPPPKK